MLKLAETTYNKKRTINPSYASATFHMINQNEARQILKIDEKANIPNFLSQG